MNLIQFNESIDYENLLSEDDKKLSSDDIDYSRLMDSRIDSNYLLDSKIDLRYLLE